MRQSRLAKKREARSLRQALLFVFLTIVLGVAVIFLGVPALIKLAVFIGDLHSTGAPIEAQDTLAPAPPQLEPPTEATRESAIKVKGFAEAGATVALYNHDVKIAEILADAEGIFLFSDLSLDNGENDIFAVAIDKAGNESQPSVLYHVVFDNVAPQITLTSPPQTSDFFVGQERLEITGKLDEDGTVMINERFVILGPEYSFNYSFPLQEGANQIKITAQDLAGNQTELEISVTRG